MTNNNNNNNSPSPYAVSENDLQNVKDEDITYGLLMPLTFFNDKTLR